MTSNEYQEALERQRNWLTNVIDRLMEEFPIDDAPDYPDTLELISKLSMTRNGISSQMQKGRTKRT